MNYRLLSVVFVVVISFSFFSILVSAKHMGGPLTPAEANQAMIIFGDSEAGIEKRCRENGYGDTSERMSKCVYDYKNGFCWWILGEMNQVRDAAGRTYDAIYYECLIHARDAGKVKIAEATVEIAPIIPIGVPSPGVSGGIVEQIGQTVIQGVQAADQILEQAERMKKEAEEKKELDKTSAINSLNQKLINQKIPSLVTDIMPSLKNGKINLWILSDSAKMKHPTQLPSTDIVKNFPIGTSDGQIVIIGQLAWGEDEKPLNILVYQRTINAILESRNQGEVVNIVMSALREGNIKFTAYSLVGTVAQKAAIIYSKFTPSYFNVKRGETKTVNFNGREATLAKNPLGQSIVSVRDSPVVYRVSRGGEALGRSTRGTQDLLKDCSPVKKAYGQCTQTAGYYSDITIPDITIPTATPFTKEERALWRRVTATYSCSKFDYCTKQYPVRVLDVTPPGPVKVSGGCEYSCRSARLSASAEASSQCFKLLDTLCKSKGYVAEPATVNLIPTPLGEEECVPCGEE